jgi:hypothetical protein
LDTTTQAVTSDVFDWEQSFVSGNRYLKDAGGELPQSMAVSFGQGLHRSNSIIFFLFYPVTFTTRQAMVNTTNLFLLRKTRKGFGFGILPACCSFVDG